MPLAHRPSAYQELRSKFCFLGKFDIISPDEIERLAEKLITLYQDVIQHRFSNELLQFVNYLNEFLDSFPNVKLAQWTNLITMVTNGSGKLLNVHFQSWNT